MGAANGALVTPFAILVGAAVCILVLALWRIPGRFTAWVSMASLVAAAVLMLIVIVSGQGGRIQGMIAVDGWTALQCLLLCGAGGAAILAELGTEQDMPTGGGYALMLLAVVGALVTASATHLFALALGLAILTVATAALLGPKTAWPYLLIHGAGLAAYLLGAVLLYGATGSLEVGPLAQALTRETAAQPAGLLEVLGAGFVLVGMAVPLGLVPFHGWIGRVYRSKWHPAPMLVSLTVPAASLAAVGRLDLFTAQAGPATLALAAVSLLWGYTSALRSRRVHGALAGISVAQSGLLLLALVGLPDAGRTAAGYLSMSSAAALACLWALVAYVEQRTGAPVQWADLWGLGNWRPILAVAASLCVFSLAALPPLTGSAALFFVLQSAIGAQRVWLAAVTLAGTLLAGLCALRWAVALWMRPPPRPYASRASPEIGLIAATAAGATVAGGLLIEPLLSWIAWLVAH